MRISNCEGIGIVTPKTPTAEPPEQADAAAENAGNKATWFIPRCKTLREQAGQRIQGLAKKAGVDRATIDKLEKRKPVTKPTAYRVLNALNELHVTKLDPNVEIISSLRKRP
jgi:DNA-binding XRE family transcriptional regulator